MTQVDNESIWLMQGWLFYDQASYWTAERAKALLTGVPLGKMIVLDLQSEEFPQYERLEQYYGQPYIWCMLHDFGGTMGNFGSISILNTVTPLFSFEDIWIREFFSDQLKQEMLKIAL